MNKLLKVFLWMFIISFILFFLISFYKAIGTWFTLILLKAILEGFSHGM